MSYASPPRWRPDRRDTSLIRVSSEQLEKVLKRRVPGEMARPFLGAMNFGKRTSEAESKAVVARALELGIEHIDTANAYGEGISETIVGDALRRSGGARDKVTIATKCGFGRVAGKLEGLSRARIREAIDGSLSRLGTDHVDVYYLHVPDHDTPIDETLDAVAELLEEKKILAWGVSNYAAWQVLEMIHKADARKMPRPVIAQQLYNVLLRQLDVEYFAFARALRAPHDRLQPARRRPAHGQALARRLDAARLALRQESSLSRPLLHRRDVRPRRGARPSSRAPRR